MDSYSTTEIIYFRFHRHENHERWHEYDIVIRCENCLVKVKHVGIKYINVTDSADQNAIKAEKTPSAENQWDAFTKVIIGEDLNGKRAWKRIGS